MVKQERKGNNKLRIRSSVKGKRKGMGSRRDEKLMFCFQNEVSGYLRIGSLYNLHIGYKNSFIST